MKPRSIAIVAVTLALVWGGFMGLTRLIGPGLAFAIYLALAGWFARYCDRDGTEGGDANAAPVPQDCHARAEGIAKGADQ